jgi:hypothetical protein
VPRFLLQVPILNGIEFKGYRLCWVHGQTSADTRAQLVAFWRNNGALNEPFEAWRRTFEVCCIAFDSADQIVGVSSVYSAPSPVLEGHFWHYRTFVRADSRTQRLGKDISHFSFKQLAETYAGEAGAPLGVITVIESPIFETAEGQQALQRGGLVRVGANATGHSIWCKRFTA